MRTRIEGLPEGLRPSPAIHHIRFARIDKGTLVFEYVPQICGHTIWPYTENNTCVLPPHISGDHRDARGRKFGITGYLEKI